jgi:homoaconitase/3-isopropylmalate dehydratase large subunit
MGGQKVNNLAEIFMVDEGVILIFLKFMCHFKSSTCSICMADFQA